MALASSFPRLFAGFNRLSYSPPSCVRYCSTLTSPRLFVRGLSRLTTNEKLQDAFASFGQLVDARMITDRETGRSKGFGFVTYATKKKQRRPRKE